MLDHTFVNILLLIVSIGASSMQAILDMEASIKPEMNDEIQKYLTAEDEKVLSNLHLVIFTDIRQWTNRIKKESIRINKRGGYGKTNESEEVHFASLYYMIMLDTEGTIYEDDFIDAYVVKDYIRKPEFMVKKAQKYSNVYKKLEALYTQNSNIFEEFYASKVMYNHHLFTEDKLYELKTLTMLWLASSKKKLMLTNFYDLRKTIVIYEQMKKTKNLNHHETTVLSDLLTYKCVGVYTQYREFIEWYNIANFSKTINLDFDNLNNIISLLGYNIIKT